MRVLLLLRGSPGCGKTTWIEQNGLKPYTLSADELRMMCAAPSLDVSGDHCISQSNDSVVWSTLFKILEVRMQNGEFTVIDATNSKTSEMNRYKEMCAHYRYRMYCVDFTGIPIETAKERNRGRTALKRVPDSVIDKMYSRFQTQKIPAGITVIKPDELNSVWLKKFDLSDYKRIHIIGDIHGCYTALKEYIDSVGGIHEDEFYIFLGDYIDRGIENAELINFMLSVFQLKNVQFLEGNHERWLWIWANDGVTQSKDFEFGTRAQLENAKVSKKDVRQLYRRFGQCAYFDYRGSTYLVTHGGLSALPDNLSLISTAQMIKGVGSYNDYAAVEESFLKSTPENCYQVHGHRNTGGSPVRANERNFNLEGRIEFGGELRVVQLCPDGGQKEVTVRNTVFKTPEELTPPTSESVGSKKDLGDVILELRQNRFIQEKRYGEISSFNFTKSAFYDKVWDEQTTKARGLYINIPRQKIVARAYEKFFNVNERPETKLDMLQHRLSFPVTAYVKENGFLGIASYNEEDDSLFVTTKSDPTGDYAVWLRAALETELGETGLEKMRRYSKENQVSFVFECVDMVHDPHIIEYPSSRVYLLDIIHNDIDFRKYDYDSTRSLANELGVRHKERAYVIESWQEFFEWYLMVTAEDYKYNGKNIEGFVLEDSNAYMVKLKLAYYNFWKFMRSIAHETLRKGYVDPRRTSALITPLANRFYGWAKNLYVGLGKEGAANIPKDICTLRKMFYDSDEGAQFKSEE